MSEGVMDLKRAYKQAYGWVRYDSNWTDDSGDYYRPPKKLQRREANELLKLPPAAIGAAYVAWCFDWHYDPKAEQGRYLRLLQEKRNYRFYRATLVTPDDPEWEPSKEWREKVARLKAEITT